MTNTRLKIRKNFRLARLTTFHIGGPAQYFAEIYTRDELHEALAFAEKLKLPLLILGGGSNMVVSDKGFKGIVLVMRLRHFTIEKETKTYALVRAAAGERWDEVVERAVARGLWGIENLSLIPGSMGAAAVQNIEAYGQEFKSSVVSVEVYDKKTGNIRTLTKTQCGFAYRKSIFNSTQRGRYIILDTLLKLMKHGSPKTAYLDVENYFKERHITKPTLRNMREAIVDIRTHKLPDPQKVGNSGSFFKNVYLTKKEYKLLHSALEKNIPAALPKLEELAARFASVKGIKIPTAFLVEACGLKGAQVGGARVHERQALVLINHTGRAKARDVLGLMKKVRQTVFSKTGIAIIPEPDLIGFTAQELAQYFSLK